MSFVTFVRKRLLFHLQLHKYVALREKLFAFASHDTLDDNE